MPISFLHPRDPSILFTASRPLFGRWRLATDQGPIEGAEAGEFAIPLADGSTSLVSIRTRGSDPFPRVTIDGALVPLGAPLGVGGWTLALLPLAAALAAPIGILLGPIGAVVAHRVARYDGSWLVRSAVSLCITLALALASFGLGVFATFGPGALPATAARDAIARLRTVPAREAVPVDTGWILPFSAEEALALRDHVREGRFAVAESLLQQLETEARRDVRREERWLMAYRTTFVAGDSLLDVALDQWTNASPRATQPLIARAWERYWLGFSYRGESVLVERVGASRFEFLLINSAQDATMALARDPAALPAYWVLQYIARAEGDRTAVIDLLPHALRQSPTSAVTYQIALLGMAPRWGGTTEMMLAIAEEAELSADLNPELARVRAYALNDVLSWSKAANSDDNALALLAREASATGVAALYTTEGHALAHRGDLPAAIAALDTALMLEPTEIHARNDRGRIHARWSLQDQANAAMHRAAAERDGRLAYALDPVRGIRHHTPSDDPDNVER